MCLWYAVYVFGRLLKCLRRTRLGTEICSTDQTQDIEGCVWVF
jgi:hypothetical protein